MNTENPLITEVENLLKRFATTLSKPQFVHFEQITKGILFTELKSINSYSKCNLKKNRFEKLCHILDISSIPPIKNPTEGDRCFKALKSVLIQNSSALISNKFNKFDFIGSCSKCNIQINNPYNFFYKYHEKICTNKTKHLWCLVKQ